MSLRFTERRRSPRTPWQSDVKVYDPNSRRYRCGRTVNVSATGVMVELFGGLHARVGEAVGVAINFTGASLLRHADLKRALVRRVEDDHPATVRIAVEYTDEHPVQQAA